MFQINDKSFDSFAQNELILDNFKTALINKFNEMYPNVEPKNKQLYDIFFEFPMFGSVKFLGWLDSIFKISNIYERLEIVDFLIEIFNFTSKMMFYIEKFLPKMPTPIKYIDVVHYHCPMPILEILQIYKNNFEREINNLTLKNQSMEFENLTNEINQIIDKNKLSHETIIQLNLKKLGMLPNNNEFANYFNESINTIASILQSKKEIESQFDKNNQESKKMMDRSIGVAEIINDRIKVQNGYKKYFAVVIKAKFNEFSDAVLSEISGIARTEFRIYDNKDKQYQVKDHEKLVLASKFVEQNYEQIKAILD